MLEIKQSRVDNCLDVDLAVRGFNDLGSVVELGDQVNDPLLGSTINLAVSCQSSIQS